MGIFQALSAGSALNRIAKTFDECINCIGKYKISQDSDYLLQTAWLLRYGVIDSMEKWHFNPITAKIYIPNHQDLGRVTISQITFQLMGALTTLGEQAFVSETISKIIEDDSVFEQYSYMISATLKDKLKP